MYVFHYNFGFLESKKIEKKVCFLPVMLKLLAYVRIKL